VRPTLFFRSEKLTRTSPTTTIRDVAERVTVGRGFELVDVEVKRAPGGQFVRIYVDKKGGIGIDELQLVSEEVSAILDVEDPLASSYTLEVSSPGLDRPLKEADDFMRFLGRLAKVSTDEPVAGRRHWTGRLTALAEGVLSLSLENEGKEVAKIPLEKIAHARLEVEFPRQA